MSKIEARIERCEAQVYPFEVGTNRSASYQCAQVAENNHRCRYHGGGKTRDSQIDPHLKALLDDGYIVEIWGPDRLDMKHQNVASWGARKPPVRYYFDGTIQVYEYSHPEYPEPTLPTEIMKLATAVPADAWIKPRTVEQIREEISNLEGELHILSGEPIILWDGNYGDCADAPEGGAILHVSWCTTQHSYDAWYPTTEAAKAALLALARREGTVPSDDGFHVDLTKPGCQSSRAWVQRND